ncbi:RtcB family protein [Benzoatithermus flavus]|uniref:tRNA-splicing ligase RtcB n=1 Tax=Benzoatithermus flavus TaxID=3108223 RepID=A0ABU8XPI8_9PROT
MNPARFTRVDATTWRLEPHGAMQVPAVIYADEGLLRAMDDKVGEQLANVASLPGIVDAAYALPDAHWGYGFPIGGVAAFDATAAGVISAGGVGFDISCGVRTMLTDLGSEEIEPLKESLADALLATVPAGLGGKGGIRLDETELDAMLLGGAVWAVARGWGEPEDLIRIEEGGRMAGAEPAAVSAAAKRRQRAEMGTLGSGNHYLEVQAVAEILDPATAEGFGLERGRIVVTIHCGSRGLGHQIGTDYLREMALAAEPAGIALPDRELACARIASELGQRYLGAMRAGINCALANREIIGQLARQVFTRLFGSGGRLRLLFDVSHNTCKLERHRCADGVERELHVHRKGATRALGPGDPSLPEALRPWGQPVLIGGSMGTGSWVLAGCERGRAFASAVHGAGRSLSRHQALRQWNGRQIVDELASHGILVRSHSLRGVAEEAPGAYKDVDAVVAAAEAAGLARRVARLRPVICIKG